MVSGQRCGAESAGRTSGDMTVSKADRSRVTVTPLDEFLGDPPEGFAVEVLGTSGYRVRSDPERSLVLIDDFSSCGRRLFFRNSLGRKVKVRNLWEYTAARSGLLSKRIYLLLSAPGESEARGRYVVSFEGSDPLIKWQMERGLDWTISSVAGESYRVDIDLSELLRGSVVWTGDPRVWRDACFTLKYYSDALFDFSHWFGFSKRAFKLRTLRARSS